jgi:hypothetical protein
MGRPRFSGLASLDPAMVHWEQVPFWFSLPYDPPLTDSERKASIPSLVLADKEREEDADSTES